MPDIKEVSREELILEQFDDEPYELSVTVADKTGVTKTLEGQSFVLVISGRRIKKETGKTTRMTCGIAGKLSIRDMRNMMLCACKRDPRLYAAMLYAVEEMAGKTDLDRSADSREQ